ncbi:MAG: hypothetical protein H7274_07090 [Rhodoferax sp.]|nr:hypothetical protein [Rhodoferax sp.]
MPKVAAVSGIDSAGGTKEPVSVFVSHTKMDLRNRWYVCILLFHKPSTQRTVEQHGGLVCAAGALGKSATFHFILSTKGANFDRAIL